MPSYKLTYFNVRGRGETIRLLFAAGGIKYEDYRLEGSAWPALKPKTPFGTLPVLEIDGKEMIGQSMSIARLVAKEAVLYGANNWEAAYIDSIVEMITELREKLFTIIHIQDEAQKEAALKEAYSKDIPDFLGKIEKFLGNHQFLSKDKLSFADIHFYSVMDIIKTRAAKSGDDNLFKKHEKAEALFQRVERFDKIAAYLKERQVLEMGQ